MKITTWAKGSHPHRLPGGTIAVALAAILTVPLAIPASAIESTVVSNFQPDPNGFQFPNFVTGDAGSGFSAPTFEFTPADTYRMAGTDGCLNPDPSASNCVVKPIIQAWEANFEQPSDGQCFGMAALSQLLFNGYLTPTQVDPTYGGSEQTYSFPNSVGPQSSALQHEIGFWFASQGFKSDAAPATAPNTAVSMLQEAFASDPNRIPYVLELSDHAITPIGVSPSSTPGWMEIQVYDNNYPNSIKPLMVNTAENSFFYLEGGYWHGSGADGNLTLQPLSGLLPISAGTAERASSRPAHRAIVRKTGGKGTGLRVRARGGRSGGKRPSVHYLSTSRTTAQANIPPGARRFSLVVTNTDDEAQVIEAFIHRGDALLEIEGLRVAPHKKVRVEFDIPAVSLKWVGAAASSARAFIDGGRNAYTVDIRSMSENLGSGTTVRLAPAKGVEALTLRPGTRGLLRAKVSRVWVDRAGTVRRTSTRLTRDAVGGRPAVIRFR